MRLTCGCMMEVSWQTRHASQWGGFQQVCARVFTRGIQVERANLNLTWKSRRAAKVAASFGRFKSQMRFVCECDWCMSEGLARYVSVTVRHRQGHQRKQVPHSEPRQTSSPQAQGAHRTGAVHCSWTTKTGQHMVVVVGGVRFLLVGRHGSGMPSCAVHVQRYLSIARFD